MAGVVSVGPGFEAVAVFRIGTAAAEHRTDVVLLDVVQMIHEVAQLGLRHLADLLLERHLLDERPNLFVVGRVRLRLDGGSWHRWQIQKHEERRGETESAKSKQRPASSNVDIRRPLLAVINPINLHFALFWSTGQLSRLSRIGVVAIEFSDAAGISWCESRRGLAGPGNSSRRANLLAESA